MKKVLAVLVVLCFAANCSAAWWSKPDTKKTADTKTTNNTATKQEAAASAIVSGKVTSTNPPQNEMVIMVTDLGYNRVYIVDPNVYNTVNIGDMVEAKVKPGSNVIDTIKVTEAAEKAETKPVQPKGKPAEE
jgi:hypothetical protein